MDATATDVDARLRSLGWVPTSFGEMEIRPAGENAEGRYEHPDDPDATLVVDVAAPGRADPYVSLGRYGPTYEEGDAQPVSTRSRRRRRSRCSRWSSGPTSRTADG